uniref:Uncharacterized protein n=1 Tax=Avena sativa TaxID=4498 RepID=A0ACD6A8H0_AVESA
MGSVQKPHVVFVPFPAHGHVAPHLQLARALHARGFHVTLVHTELHYRRLQRAKGAEAGAEAAAEATWFDVEVIPDGLSLEAPPSTLEGHLDALERNCRQPFTELLRALANRPGAPPVSCVVADSPMSFAALAARDVGVPDVNFFTASACGLMGYLQFEELVKRGLVPLKGSGYKTDGSLEAPRMQTTRCSASTSNRCVLSPPPRPSSLTLSTTSRRTSSTRSQPSPPIYTVGPLSTIVASLPGDSTDAASLLKEDTECMAWLDGKEARSVVYVSYGSHAAMSADKIKDFASGLARCGSPYLWVLRPDMAANVEVGQDGLVVPWCAQEAVLAHPAVGLFVTHCGWNSILETVLAGVPVLGWPMISEQTTNCRQLSTAWNIGTELPQEAGSDEIAALVRAMLVGKKGMEARERTLEWKRLAEDATKEGGSSYVNLDRLVQDVLHKGL